MRPSESAGKAAQFMMKGTMQLWQKQGFSKCGRHHHWNSSFGNNTNVRYVYAVMFNIRHIVSIDI